MYIYNMYVYLCMRYFNTYMFFLSLSLYMYIYIYVYIIIYIYTVYKSYKTVYLYISAHVGVYIRTYQTLRYITFHSIAFHYIHTQTYIYIYIYIYIIYTHLDFTMPKHRRFHSSSILPMTHAYLRRRAPRIWTGSSWRSWTLSNIFFRFCDFQVILGGLGWWFGSRNQRFPGNFEQFLCWFCLLLRITRFLCLPGKTPLRRRCGRHGADQQSVPGPLGPLRSGLDIAGFGWIGMDFCGFCEANSVFGGCCDCSIPSV